MNDPWQILILDCNTATEKDVKAAYARLVKQHRPDSDPEGFRRVRDAYETAMAMVRDRDARGMPSPAYSQPVSEEGASENSELPVFTPVFTPPAVELPEAVQSSFAEVERAVASGNIEQVEAAMPAFLRQCEAARVDPSICANALRQVCGGNAKLLASAAPIPFLLTLAEHGQVEMSHLVLSEWAEENRRDRITQFGSAILDRAHGLATPEGAMLMARVGVMIGLEKPGMATSLGNLAFPHLPVDLRGQIMGQLEHEAALGAAFEDVTAEMKPFWFKRLRHANEPHDWLDAESLKALSDLIHRNRHVWQGWGIVQQLMPPKQWAPVETRLRQQAHQVTQSTPRASKFPGWLVVPMILIGLNVLRFLGSEASHPTGSFTMPPSYTPSSGYDKYLRVREENERQKAVRESLRIPDTALDHMRSVLSTPISRPGVLPLDSSVVTRVNPATIIPPVLPTPVPAAPAQNESTTHSDYLNSLQNGTLFDGSRRAHPPQ